MLTVYKTLLRPHLEYATQVWNLPATHGSWGLILDIEKVQREFTRAIQGFRKKTYKARLQELRLTTLLERRMRGDLIETFKICNGLVDYGKKPLSPNFARFTTNIKRQKGRQDFS